jgi:hypothetical protein
MSTITGGSAPTVRMKLYYSGTGTTIKVARSINGGAYADMVTVTDSTYSAAGYAGIGIYSTQAPTDSNYAVATNFSIGPPVTTATLVAPVSGVVGHQSPAGSVTLDSLAPSGGVVANLSSSVVGDTFQASLGGGNVTSVTIPQGTTSVPWYIIPATFNARTVTLTSTSPSLSIAGSPATFTALSSSPTQIYTDTFVDVNAPISIGAHATTTAGLSWTHSGDPLTVTAGGNVVTGINSAWANATVGTLMAGFNEEASIDINFGSSFPVWGSGDFQHIVVYSRASAPTGGTGYAAMIELSHSNTYVIFYLFKLASGSPTTSIGSYTDNSLTMASIMGGSPPSIRMKLFYAGSSSGNTPGNTVSLARSINGSAYSTVISASDSSFTTDLYAGIGMYSTQAATDTHYGRITNFSLGPVGTPPSIGDPSSLSSTIVVCTEGDAYSGLHFGYSLPNDGTTFYAFQQGLSHYSDSTYGIRDPNLTLWNGKWYVAYSPAGGAFGKTDSRIIKILSSPDLINWTLVTTIGPSWMIDNAGPYTNSNQPSDLYIDTPQWVIDSTGPHIFFMMDKDPLLAANTMCEIHPTSSDLTTWSGATRLKDNTSAVIDPTGQKSICYLGGGQYALYTETYDISNNPTGMKRWASSNPTTGYTLTDTYDNSNFGITSDTDPTIVIGTGHVLMPIDSYGVSGGMRYCFSSDMIGRTWNAPGNMTFANMTAPSEAQFLYLPSTQAPFASPSSAAIRSERFKIWAGTTGVMVPIHVTNSATESGLGGLVPGAGGLTAEYRREGGSSWTPIPLLSAAMGSYTSGGWVADGNVAGAYEVGIPNAALAAGARWAEVRYYGATNMSPVVLYFELDAVNYQSPAAFITGVNSLAPPTAWNTDVVQTGDSYARIGSTGSGLTSLASASAVAALPTAAAIATAIFTDTTSSDFTTAGSPGKILVTQLGGTFTTTSSSVFSTASLANGSASGNVTVAGYATGQDPATLLLVTPANKLATDSSGRVTAGTVSDKTGYSLTQAFPANFASMAITSGGAVTAGTVSDKTGYSLTQAFPANFASLQINAGGSLTAVAISPGGITASSFAANAITAAAVASSALDNIGGPNRWNLVQTVALTNLLVGGGKRTGVPAVGSAGTVTIQDAFGTVWGTVTVDTTGNITATTLTPQGSL